MRYLFFLCISVFSPLLQANIHFLSIADIHYGEHTGKGPGHDTNISLLTSAMDKFAHLSHKVDFILTLGDFRAHRYFPQDRSMSALKTVFHALYEADKAKKPMFYITGNNDSLEGNYRPFLSHGQSPLSLAPVWKKACVYCKTLLIDTSHLRSHGYYSTYVIPGNKEVILIALNSIPFTIIPFPFYYPHQQEDALEELHWLEVQLKKHPAKQRLIAMHIPPGMNYKGKSLWHPSYLDTFMAILHRASHQKGEISLLTAHTHMDDLRKLYLTNNRSIYAYATPSISRIHYNNPGMKVFGLDNQYHLQSYTTYYTLNDVDWKNHYSTKTNQPSLFSQCHKNSLAACLDSLTNKAVCSYLVQHQWYSVKSPQLNEGDCTKTYAVHSTHIATTRRS